LKFYRTGQLKFVYRLKFFVEAENIIVTGQYCIPNFYQEAIEFKDTEMKKVATELDAADITDDFNSVFIASVDIK
jgi:hypothetical protein